MNVLHATGFQHISNIASAGDIKDNRLFEEFCITELDKAKEYFNQNKEYVSLETMLFHVYFLLKWRISETNMVMSDRTEETVFQFFQNFIPYFNECFVDNQNGCLSRAMSYCISYIDNDKKLRTTKSLSDDTLLAILDCIFSLLKTVDFGAISSYFSHLDVPIDTVSDEFWDTLHFIPSVAVSTGVTYLKNEEFNGPFTILFFHLTELLASTSRSISRKSLCCIECLLLITGSSHIAPLLPALLSCVTMSARMNSLITWREKQMSLLIFGHALSLIVDIQTTDGVGASDMIGDWLVKARGEEKKVDTVKITREESESLSSYHGRIVLSELSTHIPPLLGLILQSVIADDQINIRVMSCHVCYMLIPAVHLYCPALIGDLIDVMVLNTTDDRSILQHVATILSEDALHHSLADDSSRSLLFSHVSQLLVKLPGRVRMQAEGNAVVAIRLVLGYTRLFGRNICEYMTTDSLRSLYEGIKQVGEVMDVCSVGVTEVGIDDTDRQDSSMFKIVYRYLNENAVKLFNEWIVLLGDSLFCFEKDLVLFVLSDCVNGNREAAILLPLLLSHHTAITPLIQEVIDTLIDMLRFASDSILNAALLLRAVTSLILATASLPTYKPQLLSLLFYYRSTQVDSGVVSCCLLSVVRALSLPSVASLALSNYDYLLDSILLKLRFAARNPSPAVNLNITMLKWLWEDLIAGYDNASKEDKQGLVIYARDSIEICVGLLRLYCDATLSALIPLTRYLVILLNNGQEEERQITTVDDVIMKYFERKLTQLSSLKPVSAPTSQPDTNMYASVTAEDSPSRPEFTAITSILSNVRFYLQSASLSSRTAAVTILRLAAAIRNHEDKVTLFSPVLSMISQLLDDPNSALFLSSMSLAMQIVSFDTHSFSTKFASEIWPAIYYALESCSDAVMRGQFESIHSLDCGMRVAQGIIDTICEVYCDDVMWCGLCDSICGWINDMVCNNFYVTKESINNLVQKMVHFNYDEVVGFITSEDPDLISLLHGKECKSCCRFVSVNENKNKHGDPTEFVKIVTGCLDYFVYSIISLKTICHYYFKLKFNK